MTDGAPRRGVVLSSRVVKQGSVVNVLRVHTKVRSSRVVKNDFLLRISIV